MTARIWDAASGKLLATLQGHTGPVNCSDFAPDSARFVTADDKIARVWDAASGRLLATLQGHEGAINSAQFSPDGTRIATASGDKTARIWDAASGKLIVTVRGHRDQVYGAQFSPDGTRIVTASTDGTARIWDAASGNPTGLSASFNRREDREFMHRGTQPLWAFTGCRHRNGGGNAWNMAKTATVCQRQWRFSGKQRFAKPQALFGLAVN
jgi:WD40 repeat protein